MPLLPSRYHETASTPKTTDLERMKAIPGWASQRRSSWRYVGRERPPFAVTPKPGQESVWDYPRPPRIARDPRDVIVRVGAVVIARSNRSARVLETASPPTFYLPPEDVRASLLKPHADRSWCEWKGEAAHWTLVVSDLRLERVAWSYADPFAGFEDIRGYFSFYPGRVACYVNSVRVRAQPGEFYGGWITPEVVGPFKGVPGSEAW